MKQKTLTKKEKIAAEIQLLQKQKEIEYSEEYYSVASLLNLFKDVNMKTLDCENHQWGFSWSKQDACWYIEEVLLGTDIAGSIELSLLNEDNYIPANDIGLRKLQAIHSFVSNELTLSGLRTLTSLEGFRFSDLSSNQQRLFIDKLIRIVVYKIAKKRLWVYVNSKSSRRI